MALFDIPDLRLDLGLEAGSEEPYFLRVQTRITEEFSIICDRDFGRHDGAETHHTDADWIYPRHVPVETVSSVTVDGGAVPDHELTGNAVWIGRSYRRRFESRVDYAYAPRLIEITYTGGYHLFGGTEPVTVPAALSELAIQYGVFLYRSRGRSLDLMSQRLGPGRQVYGDTVQGLPRPVYMSLRRWNRARSSL